MRRPEWLKFLLISFSQGRQSGHILNSLRLVSYYHCTARQVGHLCLRSRDVHHCTTTIISRDNLTTIHYYYYHPLTTSHTHHTFSTLLTVIYLD